MVYFYPGLWPTCSSALTGVAYRYSNLETGTALLRSFEWELLDDWNMQWCGCDMTEAQLNRHRYVQACCYAEIECTWQEQNKTWRGKKYHCPQCGKLFRFGALPVMKIDLTSALCSHCSRSTVGEG